MEDQAKIASPVRMSEISYTYFNLRSLPDPTEQEKEMITHLLAIMYPWVMGVFRREF